jgi:hypothetical protein
MARSYYFFLDSYAAEDELVYLFNLLPTGIMKQFGENDEMFRFREYVQRGKPALFYVHVIRRLDENERIVSATANQFHMFFQNDHPPIILLHKQRNQRERSPFENVFVNPTKEAALRNIFNIQNESDAFRARFYQFWGEYEMHPTPEDEIPTVVVSEEDDEESWFERVFLGGGGGGVDDEEQRLQEGVSASLREFTAAPEPVAKRQRTDWSKRIENADAATVAVTGDPLCACCLENKANVCAIPCGHVVSCSFCTHRLFLDDDARFNKCILCSTKIEDLQMIFFGKIKG